MPPIRILIIEDDADIADLLAATLEPTFECLRAVNGLEGLQLATAGQPDLIISDIMMPLMDGYEFISKLRNEPDFAKTPVVFLSALGTREQIREGYDLGAALYLTKPIDPMRMKRNVELFIDDHAIGSGSKRATVKKVEELFAKGLLGDPTAPAAPEESTPSASKAGAGKGSARPRVLIVEDDQEGSDLIKGELEESFEVLQAADGIEAIERAVRYEPDLFIVDGMLPKMTGYQLVTMLRKNSVFRDHPIIMISAKASNRDRQYVLKLGVKYFLPKPFEMSDLVDMLGTITTDGEFEVKKNRISYQQIGLEGMRDFDVRR